MLLKVLEALLKLPSLSDVLIIAAQPHQQIAATDQCRAEGRGGNAAIFCRFDEHPWGTFDAPVVVEDAAFPGMKQWPSAFTMNDEIYQIKNFSRTTTRVLMRLDPSKLDLNNPRVHRDDRDFAVTWAKMYGKGRVFYSTLGHVKANWDKPEMQTMVVDAIKWVLKLIDADVTPRAAR